jgi:hypothetical protein
MHHSMKQSKYSKLDSSDEKISSCTPRLSRSAASVLASVPSLAIGSIPSETHHKWTHVTPTGRQAQSARPPSSRTETPGRMLLAERPKTARPSVSCGIRRHPPASLSANPGERPSTAPHASDNVSKTRKEFSLECNNTARSKHDIQRTSLMKDTCAVHPPHAEMTHKEQHVASGPGPPICAEWYKSPRPFTADGRGRHSIKPPCEREDLSHMVHPDLRWRTLFAQARKDMSEVRNRRFWI